MELRVPILISLVLLLASSAAAQTASQRANGFEISGMVQMGIPQNEFGEAFNGTPSGIAGSISLPMGKSQILRFGAEYAWRSMGKTSSEIEIDKPVDILIGDMEVSSETRSGHAFMRLSPSRGAIRPYFDLMFGITSYTTDTEVTVEEVDGIIVTTTERLAGKTTNTYGFAGGIAFSLSDNLFFDVKLQSIRGGAVEYADHDEVEINTNGDIIIDFKETSTDLLIPQVGLSIFF